MSSPKNSINGLQPEFDNVISSDRCHPNPCVIYIFDTTVLSELIPLTAVTWTVSCFQEGIINKSNLTE